MISNSILAVAWALSLTVQAKPTILGRWNRDASKIDNIPGALAQPLVTQRVYPTCAPRTCGAICAVVDRIPIEGRPGGRKPHDQKDHIEKRGDPMKGDWTDPSDHKTPDRFLPDETRRVAAGVARDGYEAKMVKIPSEKLRYEASITSSNWITFKDKVAALSVERLYGCTSIVLVSQRGAYASRIWESNFGNWDTFQLRAIYEPHWGLPRENRNSALSEYMEYGLVDFKNNSKIGSQGTMFGDEANTAEALGMRAFIVTARERHPHRDKNGHRVPDEILHDPKLNEGKLLYADKVHRLSLEIKETFGNIPVEVVDYPPLQLRWEDFFDYEVGTLTEERAGEILSDPNYKTPRGKLLIQYRPAQTCEDKAAWRLWIEQRGIDGRTDKWQPRDDQIFQRPGASPARREECLHHPITRPVVDPPPPETAPPASTSTRSASKANTDKGESSTQSTPSSRPESSTSSLPATTKGSTSWIAKSSTQPTLQSSLDLGRLGPSNTKIGTHVANKTTAVTYNALFETVIKKPASSQSSEKKTVAHVVSETTEVTTYVDSTKTITKTPSPKSSKTKIVTHVVSKTTVVTYDGSTKTTPKETPPPKSSKKKVVTHVVSETTVVAWEGSPKETPSPEAGKQKIVTHVVSETTVVTWDGSPHTTTKAIPPPKPPKPSPTTPKQAPSPSPEPSEAAYIHLEYAVLATMQGGDIHGGMWVMFPVNLSETLHVCDTGTAGYYNAPPRTSANTPGLPPSFEANKEIFGRKNCKYIGGYETQSSGRFSCDGVPEFDCIEDPQMNEKLDCAGRQERFFVPRVRCLFPPE